MLAWQRRYGWLLILALSAVGIPVRAAVAAASASVVPARSAGGIPIRLGNAIIPLTGPWKFRTGDNPAWAQTELDDAGWQSMDLTPPAGSIDPGLGTSGYIPGWTASGHPGYSGYAWYRVRLHLEPGEGPLALLMPTDVDDGYQVYANGRLLGSFGNFRGAVPRTYYGQPMLFQLPQVSNGGAYELVLALRFYMKPAALLEDPTPGGMHGPPLIGLAPVVQAYYRLQRNSLARTYDFYLMPILLYLLAALAAFTLYLLDRSQRVFLWLGAAAAMNVLYRVFVLDAILATRIDDQWLIFRPLLLSVVLWTWLMAWCEWFQLSSLRWLPRLITILTAIVIGIQYLQFFFLGRTMYPFFTSSPWELAARAAHLLLGCMPFAILYFGVRQLGRESWIAAPALVLLAISVYPEPLVWLHVPLIWFAFGIQISTRLVAELGISLWIMLLLLLRFQRSQRTQQQLQNEMRQAQQVQHTLLPEPPSTLPGFHVECLYRPAEEVGGDFFQVMPGAEGDLLIVLGDVSGKGLRAAMLVSLIIGTLRTLAEQNLSVAELLQGMNRRLHKRMEGGFATCICASIRQDGHMTLANAGHLAPYLNGEEMSVPSGLPLGLVAEMEYEQMECVVPAGGRLVFLTDGVVEARNRKGELYGFDRTSVLIRQPLEQIVHAAIHFGQEDDITVIGLQRDGAGVQGKFPGPAVASLH